MKILLTVHLYARETNFLKSGDFAVLSSEFRKDPDWTAAIVAYEWIRQINREFGYSDDFKINKVIYNEDIDITELVKKVEPIEHDDLPF